jgi:hypothetical protein
MNARTTEVHFMLLFGSSERQSGGQTRGVSKVWDSCQRTGFENSDAEGESGTASAV